MKKNNSLSKFFSWTRVAPYMFIMPSMVLTVCLLGIPLILSVFTSFQFNKLNVPGVYFNGIDNYTSVLGDRFFMMTLMNTLKWVFFSVSLQFVLGLSLALILSTKFKGKGVYQTLVLLPWAVPGFLVGLLWKWLFNGQFGVINDILMRFNFIDEPIAFLAQTTTSLPSVIIANIWFGVPFFGIMLLSALQSVPYDVYEAADIDGAGRITKFVKITLSFIKPVIVTTILLRVIWIFNSADLIYIMTDGGPRNSSSTLAIFIIRKAFTDMNFGQASALGVIFLVLLSLYTVIYFYISKFQQAGDF